MREYQQSRPSMPRACGISISVYLGGARRITFDHLDRKKSAFFGTIGVVCGNSRRTKKNQMAWVKSLFIFRFHQSVTQSKRSGRSEREEKSFQIISRNMFNATVLSGFRPFQSCSDGWPKQQLRYWYWMWSLNTRANTCPPARFPTVVTVRPAGQPPRRIHQIPYNFLRFDALWHQKSSTDRQHALLKSKHFSCFFHATTGARAK